MNLNIYNTISRRTEEFKPLKKGKVGLYTCGPTVYNYAHIGNLRTYVFEDILKRVLLFLNYKVKHVMNITDVGHLTSDADTGEDKMEKGAKREGKSAWDIARFYTEAFEHDIAELNILPPDIWCRATDHIKEQIKLVKILEKKGYTYITADGVYFDTAKFPDYGKMANLKNQQLQAGARVELGDKKNPTDFALWKFSPKDSQRQMEWKSPWGVGFPGWHIECSAMAVKYLRQPFDIHCGGIDHIPVHHTNEIAQSEAATGKPLANYWLHGEYLMIKLITCSNCGKEYDHEKYLHPAELKASIKPINPLHGKQHMVNYSVCPKCGLQNSAKMAKSGDNFLTLSLLKEKGFDPLAYRFFLLQTHYRKQLNFSWEALQAAQNGYRHFLSEVVKIPTLDKTIDTKISQKFTSALEDDLNLPEALALVWDAIKSKKIDQKTIFELDKVLGLDLKNQTKKLSAAPTELPEEVKKLVAQRETARQNKDWAKSDELRGQIEKLGYKIKDQASGAEIAKL